MQKLTICCLFLSLLAACSKHHDKPGDPGGGPHGTVIRLKTAGANTYTYDSLGRLFRINFSNSVTGRSEYAYTKDSVVENDFDQQGNRQGPILIYYLNNDTLTSHIRYILAPTAPALFFRLTYDADKRLTEEIAGNEGSAPDSRVVNYYSHGNEDSSLLFSAQTGQLVETTRYEYYTDKSNWLDPVYNGISYLGTGSMNLLKKITELQTGDTTVIEYTYEFDADNKPIKRHATLNGDPWGDIDYTWVTLQL
ncbi:MAG TPA: hypothetical protein VHD83_18705 [Puia sp.]|nr:hypothetical protein [Puia sp.]